MSPDVMSGRVILWSTHIDLPRTPTGCGHFVSGVVLLPLGLCRLGGGGGRPTFAQGGGSYPEGLDQALNEAKKLVGF